MKLVVAMIDADKLPAIQETLKEPDACIMYVSPVGDVRESELASYRGLSYREPRPRLRLEIVVVNDLVVSETIDAINRAASSPKRERVSSGSIFVMPLEEWVRISADRPRPVPNAEEPVYSTREAS